MTRRCSSRTRCAPISTRSSFLSQRDRSDRFNITFDGFFVNVMFHEVAHGLGSKHHQRQGLVTGAKSVLAHRGGRPTFSGLYMIASSIPRRDGWPTLAAIT